MRFLLITLLSSFLFTGLQWGNDLEKAKQTARDQHHYILLNFSGSDWCAPCIRLHRNIFESDIFEKYAKDQLVLVNADFPRLKKNQLPKEQQQKNDAMADKYNNGGAFPLTLLLDANGNVIKKWDGDVIVSPQDFVNQIKTATDAGKQ
ncbi:MAG: thioredoxin family protein [Ferruginibacter sp.]